MTWPALLGAGHEKGPPPTDDGPNSVGSGCGDRSPVIEHDVRKGPRDGAGVRRRRVEADGPRSHDDRVAEAGDAATRRLHESVASQAGGGQESTEGQAVDVHRGGKVVDRTSAGGV